MGEEGDVGCSSCSGNNELPGNRCDRAVILSEAERSEESIVFQKISYGFFALLGMTESVLFMESGKWRVESGEWRVESGEWRVESGEWDVFLVLRTEDWVMGNGGRGVFLLIWQQQVAGKSM
jgi:hypothetical protein